MSIVYFSDGVDEWTEAAHACRYLPSNLQIAEKGLG